MRMKALPTDAKFDLTVLVHADGSFDADYGFKAPKGKDMRRCQRALFKAAQITMRSIAENDMEELPAVYEGIEVEIK